jgi:hypothetical protein
MPKLIDDPWCEHLPLLHQVLAESMSPREFPSPADARTLEEACPRWEALHYLFTALLGWEHPGLGLAWWYSAGKPTGDSPVLKTVADIWDGDHQLDYYAAWSWTQSMQYPNTATRSASSFAADSLYDELNWWREFLRRPDPQRPNPFYGGTNPLHLGHSDRFGFDECDLDQAELYHDIATRRAVLVANRFTTWRADLGKADALLPDLGSRSWYVSVFDSRVGYLGLFRKSRETGRWFQGKHSIHVKGNKGL